MALLRCVPFLFLSLCICAIQGRSQEKQILAVDRWSIGPFARQKSVSCLTVYADGKVNYFHRWNPGKIVVATKTGKKTLLERVVSVESRLTRVNLLEISDFLAADTVKTLDRGFVVPHVYIDYQEGATIYIGEREHPDKVVSVRDYGEADLERKSRFPAALILLMNRIETMEEDAAAKGKTVKIPTSCSPTD